VPEMFDTVVEELIGSGEIKVWKAKEIISEIIEKEETSKKGEDEILKPIESDIPSGYGKIILLGEHAVVYGSHSIAAPLPLAMQVKVMDSKKEGIHLLIPRWGVEERIMPGVEHKYSIFKSLDLILDELDLHERNMSIEVFPHIPRAMGLGGSAALAVALIRGLADHFNLELTDARVADLSYRSETIVHGRASGIDNTLATYGKFIRFKKGTPPQMQNIIPKEPIRVVIGLTWVESLTAKMVSKVNKGWKSNKPLFEKMFNQIDEIVLEGEQAIKSGDLVKLGQLMNVNQGYLNALGVSGKEIEEIVDIARSNGALGAKLTGGGGGGAIIALCPDNHEKVSKAIRTAGYQAMVAEIK